MARLELGQDPAYGGEDWAADGYDDYDRQQEVHQRGALNVADCPARHALRPSFFAADGTGKPLRARVEGKDRGYSGALAGDYASRGNGYALKVQSLNAGIFINGGALDDKDRDPDGPGVTDPNQAFAPNPNAAAEVAPLKPNEKPDHMDVSMEGPNGFLVRLLNNLDAIVTNGATSNLGVQVVESRPLGGFKSLDDLKPVLGQVRYEQFKSYLTLHAWVDPKVVKPQPMDGRPQRWEDIDDAHRIGTEAKEIAGVHWDPTPFGVSDVTGTGTTDTGIATPFPRLTLDPGIRGNGKEAPPSAASIPWTPLDATVQGALGTTDGPWTQTITATNKWEKTKTYPVRWERDFVYAWNQLRPGPIALEPRSPLSLNTAPQEVLASVFLGLKGTYLEVWEGSAGWDAGFGFTREDALGYPYPSRATEETPWFRSRVDYGMTYGASTGFPPARPWYGPATYNPHDASTKKGGGTPVILSAPLGRLKETDPVTPAQAQAGALQARQAITDLGPARTWAKVHAFVDALPCWEDVNEDSLLDGAPYPVKGSGGAYTRRIYVREDANGDFILQRGTFNPLPGTSWKTGAIGWLDPHLPKASLEAFDLVPGLTFLQKDVIKAMINPNTDLNCFNPDGNLWKEADKTDVAGIKADPASYVHTTELSLDDATGPYDIRAAGKVTARGGHLLALRQAGALARLGEIYRDTTQHDFMQGTREGQPAHAVFQAPPAPYALAGNQPLVSYPEPRTLGDLRGADAPYDGQISLGFIAAAPMEDETFRGDLFDTVDAGGTQAVPDLDGPFQNPLLLPTGANTGNVFPDGVYSEKDRSLKFRMKDVLDYASRPGRYPSPETYSYDVFYIGCWAKPNWFPEASPRAHALVSLSPSFYDPQGDPYKGHGFGQAVANTAPVVEISAHPEGLYFVPARNNIYQDQMQLYNHSAKSTEGMCWPCHSLLWGSVHTFWASDDLNRKGILELPPGTRPVGRLEAHRWVHLAMAGSYSERHNMLILGRRAASKDGGGWRFFGFYGGRGLDFHSTVLSPYALSPTHGDGTDNHLRFGEVAGEHNMNYVADATFAGVRAGQYISDATGDWSGAVQGAYNHAKAYLDAFTGASSPAVFGRYYKESWAAHVSAKLPEGVRPLKATWTEIPCDLWFDKNGDGWLGDPVIGANVHPGIINVGVGVGYIPVFSSNTTGGVGASVNVGAFKPLNDQFGAGGTAGRNNLRDVHIELELWDDRGTDDKADDVRMARFDDPAADNRIPRPQGRLYYKAVFVNEWHPDTRANYPLDVTPFLDDVTITLMDAGGPRILGWDSSETE